MLLKAASEFPRVDAFLTSCGEQCFVRDYGHAPVSFKSICSLYGNMYFVAIETMLNIKVFYFRGSVDRFKKRCEEILREISWHFIKTTSKISVFRIWSIGYIPALFTVDFSTDKFADAIRMDFLKFGYAAYDSGENLLGKIYNCECMSMNLEEFKHARLLNYNLAFELLTGWKKRGSRI